MSEWEDKQQIIVWAYWSKMEPQILKGFSTNNYLKLTKKNNVPLMVYHTAQQTLIKQLSTWAE